MLSFCDEKMLQYSAQHEILRLQNVSGPRQDLHAGGGVRFKEGVLSGSLFGTKGGNRGHEKR